MGIIKDYHCGNMSIIKGILDIKMMSFYVQFLPLANERATHLSLFSEIIKMS